MGRTQAASAASHTRTLAEEWDDVISAHQHLLTLANEWHDVISAPGDVRTQIDAEFAPQIAQFEALCSELGIDQTADALRRWEIEHRQQEGVPNGAYHGRERRGSPSERSTDEPGYQPRGTGTSTSSQGQRALTRTSWAREIPGYNACRRCLARLISRR